MTEKERYETMITVLVQKVKEQEATIGYLKWRNDDLEKKLTEAGIFKPAAAEQETETE